MILLKSSLSFGIFDSSLSRLAIVCCCSMFCWYRKLSHWNIVFVSLLTLAKEAANIFLRLANCNSVFCFFLKKNIILVLLLVPTYINISFFGTILGML